MSFDNGVLLVEYASGYVVSIRAEDIKVMGESTNQDGPLGDDWFWNVALGPEKWFEFPVGMMGQRESLTALYDLLEVPPSWSLANCTNFNSVIHYPPSLAGKPLLKYKERKKGVWFKWPLFGYWVMDQSMSDEVEAFFQAAQS